MRSLNFQLTVSIATLGIIYCKRQRTPSKYLVQSSSSLHFLCLLLPHLAPLSANQLWHQSFTRSWMNNLPPTPVLLHLLDPLPTRRTLDDEPSTKDQKRKWHPQATINGVASPIAPPTSTRRFPHRNALGRTSSTTLIKI